MKGVLYSTKLFLKRNSSTILTCLGAMGVVATAVSAVKATPKAMTLLQQAEDDKQAKLTKWESFKIAAPAYIPAALIGASTITCIFGANILNKRTQAALTSAYALLDNSYREYRGKVKDIYGEEGHKRILKAVYDDKLQESQAFPASDDKIGVFDFFSLQFFESTLDDIRAAEQFVNDSLEMRGYVSLVEFYDRLNIPCADVDYTLGWSTVAGRIHGYDRVEFAVEKIVDENGERYILDMINEPTNDYFI